MPRSNTRHLAAAATMTLAVAVCCAPVAWWFSGAAGLRVVAASSGAILLVAALTDALTWLLGGTASPALALVSGATCRMAFVIAIMLFALKASPAEFTEIEGSHLAIYLIPFYFGLLVVEVFTAKRIPSGSQSSTPTPPDQYTPPATA